MAPDHSAPDVTAWLLAPPGNTVGADEARLVESHVPLVKSFARRYARFGVPQADLVQEGLIGLLQAVRKFDPSRDVRLGTYAAWWVRAAMQDYVVRSWSVVRPGKTAPHRALFFALVRKAAELRTETGLLGEDVLARLSTRFRLPPSEVAGMATRLSARDHPLPPAEEGAEALRAADPTPEEVVEARSMARFWRKAVEAGLAVLPPREAAILRLRHLSEPGSTLEALAHELGISKARVVQLERRALERFRQAVEPMAGALLSGRTA